MGCCEAKRTDDKKQEFAANNLDLAKDEEVPGKVNHTEAENPLVPENKSAEAPTDPHLVLEVLEGQAVDPGNEYKIGPLRSAAYLGRKLVGEAVENYIELPACETAVGVKHMLLEYNRKTRGYYAKDNGSDSGTFLKIERPLKLKQGYIFAFGESSMAVTLAEERKISLKFLGGSKEDQSFTFNELETLIKIGREPDCHIRLDEEGVSRRQCSLTFNAEEKGWFLEDGFEGKHSTNGTWLFLTDLFELHDKDIIKLGQTTFVVNIIA